MCGRWPTEPVQAADVVGVVVRVDHVRDAQSLLRGDLQVHVDVKARIDHDRLSPVPQDVGGAPEIPVEHLPEEHAASLHDRRSQGA